MGTLIFDVFRNFLTIFSLTVHLIFQWEHHILSIEACGAIQPVLNCFISMTISVESLLSVGFSLMAGQSYIYYVVVT